MDKNITIRDLFEKKEKEFLLETISGEEGLNKKITVSDTNRMGLALTGFFDYFPSQRVQILGLGEITYLKSNTVKIIYI